MWTNGSTTWSSGSVFLETPFRDRHISVTTTDATRAMTCLEAQCSHVADHHCQRTAVDLCERFLVALR